MERAARSYWDQIALSWHIAEPLAPGRADIAWFEHQAARYEVKPARALLLGVTAGIATMRWPAGASLFAADWSTNMLKNVWPTAAAPAGAGVICADWRELPLPDAGFDLVLGDGCYTALGSMGGAAALNAEMRRVLKRRGLVLLRCFCRPASGLRIDDLFEALFARRIRNLDLFRWLLAMALQGPAATGVAVRAIWEQWVRRVPDGRALQPHMGWSDDELANVERMAAAKMIYNFASLDELLQAAAPAFEIVGHDTPDYAWGGMFPRIVLRAR
jgi:SAM-dependent methyltransferase